MTSLSPHSPLYRHSAKIIRQAVFGMDENQKVKAQLTFPQNNLTVTNVDIQSVEPVDQRTRESLMKSVQLAIEITTNRLFSRVFGGFLMTLLKINWAENLTKVRFL